MGPRPDFAPPPRESICAVTYILLFFKINCFKDFPYFYLSLEVVEDKDLVVDVELVVLDEAGYCRTG